MVEFNAFCFKGVVAFYFFLNDFNGVFLSDLLVVLSMDLLFAYLLLTLFTDLT
jgi:hypothetical protein